MTGIGPERAVASQDCSPDTRRSITTERSRQIQRPITKFYSYIMARSSGGNWSTPLTGRDMLRLLPHFTFQIRLTGCTRSLPVGHIEKRIRICLSSLWVQPYHASYSSMFVPEGSAK
jgi:hypothetical protein